MQRSLAVAAVTMAIAAISCSQQTGTIVEPRKTDPAGDETFSLGRVSNVRFPRTGELVGTVVLQSASQDRAVVVAVDTFPTDERVDRIFVLQSEFALGSIAQHHEASSVTFSRNQVLVTVPPTGMEYVLQIGRQLDPPLQVVKPASARVFHGYGLTRRSGSFTFDEGGISTADLARVVDLTCDTSAGSRVLGGSVMPLDIKSCQAGGLGSNYCSITCNAPPGVGDCATSCDTGYYACCNCLFSGPSCMCYRNP